MKKPEKKSFINRTHCATQPSSNTIEREAFNNASKEM